MQPLWANVAAIAVVAIYYLWRNLDRAQRRRELLLRGRVAYMLWTMADGRDRPSGYWCRPTEN
ncbi:MAG TPA: hypothetical protein VFE78_25430 [Gemmataceae bacterium]|jgi:hypothetical protein|nr:hypothetical protein [Gemmataceae bacterium]